MDAARIVTTFVLIDTAMTNLDHQTDIRAGVPDNEVVTVALTLPFGAVLLGDCGYVGEPLCHQLDARYGIAMIAAHRTNMQPNTPAEQRFLRMHHRRIETCNSQLEKMGVARIHVRLATGVVLKIAASLCALSVSNSC